MTSANRPAGLQKVRGIGERLAARKRRRSPKREALVAKTSCGGLEAGGLEGSLGSESGAGHPEANKGAGGAGCRSQVAEVGAGARKGKDVGVSFGKVLQTGLRMLEMIGRGRGSSLGVDVGAGVGMSNLLWVKKDLV